MNFKVKIGEFTEALDKISESIDRKGHVSSPVYLLAKQDPDPEKEGLYLYATNFMCEALSKVKCKVEQAGKTILNADPLYAGLANRDPLEVLSFAPVNKDKEFSPIRIKSTRGQFTVNRSTNSVLESDYLKHLPLASDTLTTVDNNVLFDLLKNVNVAAAKDDSHQNYKLSAVKLDFNTNISAGATDGLIAGLSFSEAQTNANLSLILAPDGVRLILKSLKRSKESYQVKIKTANNKVYFQTESLIMGCSTLSGPFAPVAQLINIPEVLDKVEVNVAELKSILHRSSAILVKNGIVNFILEDKKLTISGQDKDISFEEFIDVISNETYKNKLDRDGLILILSVTTSELITLGLPKNIKQPVRLWTTNEDTKVATTYIVMPRS
jgi:DNA polymerase III sliding clamp (beta) subunit (PCNA family)